MQSFGITKPDSFDSQDIAIRKFGENALNKVKKLEVTCMESLLANEKIKY